MKVNQWTLGLAAMGVISLPAVAMAEEAQHQVMTALSSTTLSGYVDTSAIWTMGRGSQVVGRSYDGADKQDGFNLNVVKVQLEKALDEGQWSAGYRVGLLFGPDANSYRLSYNPNATTASDLFLPGNSYLGIKEAYVALRAPLGRGLDLKVGVFDGLLGYESFEAGKNPNYSRSFGYWTEPHSHTGVLASYRFSDLIAVSAGVANTGDWPANSLSSRSGIESLKTYMAALTITAPESAGFLKDATLDLGFVDEGRSEQASISIGGVNLDRSEDALHYYAGVYLPLPIEGLKIGASYDYAAHSLYNHSYMNAVAGYVSYQVTDRLKLSNRAEYATGSSGAWWVVANPNDNVRLFGETFTVDYSLWGSSVITRAEFRWDHSLTGQGLFNDGNDRNALSLALNVIYQF